MERAYIEKCPISEIVIREFKINDDRWPVSSICTGPHLPDSLPGETAKDYQNKVHGSPNTPHMTVIEIK